MVFKYSFLVGKPRFQISAQILTIQITVLVLLLFQVYPGYRNYIQYPVSCCYFSVHLHVRLSMRRAGFSPRPFHVGIVLETVALGQVFLRVFWFSLSVSSTTAPCSFLHSFIYHRRYMNLTIDSVVK